jgi:hypothetical protein
LRGLHQHRCLRERYFSSTDALDDLASAARMMISILIVCNKVFTHYATSETR